MIIFSPYDPVYYEGFKRLLDGMDPTYFYLKDGEVLAYSHTRGNIFRVRTDIGVPCWIRIYDNGSLFETIFMEDEEKMFPLMLSPGKHNLKAEQATSATGKAIESVTLTVSITRYALWIHAYAKELYQNVWRILDDHQIALLSPWSTRRVEHLLPYRHLMLPMNVARTLGVRLTLRAIINEPGGGKGSVDFLTGLTYQTPLLKRLRERDDSFFDPYVNILLSPQEQAGGHDFHIWLPNSCATEWATFLRLRHNIKDNYKLLSANEYQIVAEEIGGNVSVHTFRSDEASCFMGPMKNLLNLFDKFVLGLATKIESELMFCPWSVPFDTQVEVPLGGRRFDFGAGLDSGTLDEGRGEDPTGNHWEGYPTSRRMDGGRFFDTMISKAYAFDAFPRNECVRMRPLLLTNMDSLTGMGGTVFPLNIISMLGIGPGSGDDWVRPADADGYPVWGIRGGVCVAIYPTEMGLLNSGVDGRGAVLLGYEKDNIIYFVNMMSIRCTDMGDVERDSVEQESPVDGIKGLRFSVFPGDWRSSGATPEERNIHVSDVSPGYDAYWTIDGNIMTWKLRCEAMTNGIIPHITLKIDRTLKDPSTGEYFLEITTGIVEGSGSPKSFTTPLIFCSYARDRVAEGEVTVNAQTLWPTYAGAWLTSEETLSAALYSMRALPAQSDAWSVILTTEETNPFAYQPYPYFIFVQRIGAEVASAVHPTPTYNVGLKARKFYRGSSWPIPLGVAIDEAIPRKVGNWALGDTYFYSVRLSS